MVQLAGQTVQGGYLYSEMGEIGNCNIITLRSQENSQHLAENIFNVFSREIFCI